MVPIAVELFFQEKPKDGLVLFFSVFRGGSIYVGNGSPPDLIPVGHGWGNTGWVVTRRRRRKGGRMFKFLLASLFSILNVDGRHNKRVSGGHCDF
jgi:hypothetical protein